MRITVKPPSPAPAALAPGALVTLRVEAADPRPLLAGPPSVAYEGRYADVPAPAFLFPAPTTGAGGRGVSTAPPAASDFRTPPTSVRNPYVDIPVHEGDRVTATLTTATRTYSATMRAQGGAPVELTLVEGASAPSPPPPSPPPAEGLTITALDAEGDVVRLDTAPGADRLIVLVPAP